MSAKESRGPSVVTHTKPSGPGRRALPTGRPSRIVGSSETAVRFARSPVAQLVERLTVNQEVAGSSPARGANYYNYFCDAPAVSTDSCAEACAAGEAGADLGCPSTPLSPLWRGSGA